MTNATMFGFKTYAPSPVWSGSVAGPVKFQPLPRREARQLYHQACRFERQTRQRGKQSGALGRVGKAVLHAFVFVFLNHRSGRLDPGYKAIAAAADISERGVARGLRKLKEAGVINWLRRCAKSFDEAGRFALAQETNAYCLNPVSQWRGYSEPPIPEAGTWGDHPCGMRDPLTEGLAALRSGASTLSMVQVFETDAEDGLASSLGRMGRAVLGNPSNSRTAKPA